MSQACVHATAIAEVPPPHDVCDACVPIGGTWVHLRQCLICGQTLCCNDSPNRHMTGHFHEVGHPVMRGGDPGDTWTWCFVEDSMIRETPHGWETYDPFLEAGALVAQRHGERGGSFDLVDDFATATGFPLGEWVAWVREARDAGALDADETRLVEAVPGWTW